MEASSAFRRCVSHISRGPTKSRCRTINNRSATILPNRTWISRTCSRTFVSTSPSLRDTPPQPEPVSQNSSAEEAVGAAPAGPNTTKSIPPKSEDHIDLTSLPGISPSYKPPVNRGQPSTSPTSASAKLDALFGKPTRKPTREDPFERALRQSSSSSSNIPKFDVASLLEDLSVSRTRPFDSSDYNAADHKLPLRLHPTLGRTQTVDPVRNLDLTRAFRLLEVKCAQNNVKRDTITQRFHVRRGQKRKLLASSRWRVAFRKGFLEECARVRRMKNQGW